MKILWRIGIFLIIFWIDSAKSGSSGNSESSGNSLEEENLEFSIPEEVPPGSLVGKISKRPGIFYRFNDDRKRKNFQFDSVSGEIRTVGILDRELLNSDSIDFLILTNIPTYFIAVKIRVEDLNDNR